MRVSLPEVLINNHLSKGLELGGSGHGCEWRSPEQNSGPELPPNWEAA